MEAAACRLPAGFRLSWGSQLLPRPLFVPRDTIMGFAAQVRSLFDLLVDVPQRVFEGDLDLYCRTLGIDPVRARQARRFAGRAPTLYGRADLYRVGRSFKLLELNVCSAVGGVDQFEIARALMRTPGFRAFADEHRLAYTHTGRKVVAALREAAAPVVTDGVRPTVALICPDGGMASHWPHLRPLAELLTCHGMEALGGEVSAVTERAGGLFLHGRRVHVVMRFLSDMELAAAAEHGRGAEAILRAHEDGRAVLWTGPENQLINNKGALALLADDTVRSALTGEEAELVDRILPWTRRVASRRTRVGTETVDLIDYCRSHRTRLMLKPAFGHGGSGIVVGWRTDDAAWAAALEEGAKRAWTVQERVTPNPEYVVDPDSGARESWATVWSAFFTPAGYAGSHVRAVPGDSGDPVIGAGAQGARLATVFHYPAADRGRSL
jgi:hypothetical protein